jgi:hypothetical protein
MRHLITIHLKIELFDTNFEYEQLAISNKQWERKWAKLITEMSHLILIHVKIEFLTQILKRPNIWVI